MSLNEMLKESVIESVHPGAPSNPSLTQTPPPGTMTNKIKYLDLAQHEITRLANSSFQTKKWCLIVMGAIWGVSLHKDCPAFHLFVGLCALIIAFWLLSSYYLQQERLFRNLYNQIITIDYTKASSDAPRLFDLNPENFSKYEEPLTTVITRPCEFFFFMALLVINCIIYSDCIATKWHITADPPKAPTGENIQQAAAPTSAATDSRDLKDKK